MESVRSVPFSSVYHALSYYLHTNPARQRYVDVLNTDRPEPKHGEDPEDVWAVLCLAVQATKENLPYKEQIAFDLYYLNKARADLSKQEIAEKVGISKRAFVRMVEELEIQLVKRELIEPPSVW